MRELLPCPPYPPGLQLHASPAGSPADGEALAQLLHLCAQRLPQFDAQARGGLQRIHCTQLAFLLLK